MTPDQATAEALEALERRRCAATAAGDTATLEEIYAPDMTMVHFRGKTQSRQDYIAEVGANPRGIEFGPMTLKLYDDVAVAIGTHDITRYSPDGESRLIKTFATRILHRAGGVWRYVFIQVTPVVF